MVLPDVAVMYDDLAIRRVPWGERELLPRYGVLAVSVMHPDRPRVDDRWRGESFHDYYVLTWTDDEYALTGYDDACYWRSLVAPWEMRNQETATRLPYKILANSIVFTGSRIADELWRRARAMFMDPQGEMIF